MQKLLSILISLCLGSITAAWGQQEPETAEQKHLIYFTDKAGTPFSVAQPLTFLSPKAIARRERQHIPVTRRDLPVSPAYVAGLKDTGVKVWYTSRWFNAAVVQGSDRMLEEIQALPYVRNSQPLNRAGMPKVVLHNTNNEQFIPLASHTPVPASSKAYGRAFHQANMLGALELHAAGFRGEGMTIAVLDAGFPGVNTIPAFSHLFQNNQIKGTFDFVEKKQNVFGAHAHGTAVLSAMAAYDQNKIIGTAYAADYLLLRTEDASSEHNIEEINWLLGAEYADSAGADIINSSLGYHTFDTPSISYTYGQLDGNTALVSKAADMAAATGMLVVVSAGNDGGGKWRYISAPADADSVLTVGAVDSLGWKASFSSFGPTADRQLKPDVVAQGARVYVLNASGSLERLNGTSFSSPILAGFAASLWQANTDKTAQEMIWLLRQIGSKATSPDNALGYGVPHFKRTITGQPGFDEEKDIYITNPVSGSEVALTLGDKWNSQHIAVSVFDITGKLVFREQLAPKKDRQVLALNPQVLQKGIYLCRIKSGSMAITLRFVKL